MITSITPDHDASVGYMGKLFADGPWVVTAIDLEGRAERKGAANHQRER